MLRISRLFYSVHLRYIHLVENLKIAIYVLWISRLFDSVHDVIKTEKFWFVKDCEEDSDQGRVDHVVLRRPEAERRRGGEGAVSGFGLRRGLVVFVEQLERDLQWEKLALR